MSGARSRVAPSPPRSRPHLTATWLPPLPTPHPRALLGQELCACPLGPRHPEGVSLRPQFTAEAREAGTFAVTTRLPGDREGSGGLLQGWVLRPGAEWAPGAGAVNTGQAGHRPVLGAACCPSSRRGAGLLGPGSRPSPRLSPTDRLAWGRQGTRQRRPRPGRRPRCTERPALTMSLFSLVPTTGSN